jgi:hypothetical protein
MTTQSNDLTGSYMKSRESANLTPAQMRLKSKTVDDFVDVGKSKFRINDAPARLEEKARSIIRDVARGVTETPKQVVGGVISAAKEAGNAVESLIGFFNTPQVLQLTNEKGEFDLDLVTKEEFKEAGGERIGDIITPGKAKSVTGGLVRGVAQFLTGFLPTTKALKATSIPAKIAAKVGEKGAKIATAAGAGLVADAVVFDPHEERLSNLVEKFPSLQNPITGYLAADPSDSEAEGRFKNALEGLGLGVLTEGLISGVRGVRSSRIAKLEAKAKEAETATIEKFASVDDVAPRVEEITPEVKAQTEAEAQPEILTDAPVKDVKPETGKPVNIGFSHNKEPSPDMGKEFAQDIEPSGKYIAPNSGKYKLPGLEYGVAEFKNPLVLEHKTTRHGGWKTDLSNTYGGKTGDDLTAAVKADGYDGIITIDGDRISESIIIDESLKIKPFPREKAPGEPPHYTEKTTVIKEKYKGRNDAIKNITDRKANFEKLVKDVKEPEQRGELKEMFTDKLIGDFGGTNFQDARKAVKQLESENIPYIYGRADGGNLGGLNAHHKEVHATADKDVRKVWGEIYAKEVVDHGGIVARDQGDEFIEVWPNFTLDEVKEIRADIEVQIQNKIKDLGLDKVAHPKKKYNGMPTGSLYTNYGLVEGQPGKYGAMDREADMLMAAMADDFRLSKAEETGYTYNKKEDIYEPGIAKQETRPIEERDARTEGEARLEELDQPGGQGLSAEELREDRGGPTFEVGSKKAGEERALNVNLKNINTTDEVKELIDNVGKEFSSDINKARREVITQEETKKLADNLNMTVDDLLNRRSGEAFNAEQALSARRILVASGENLVGLAKKAVDGSEEQIIEFRQALSKHHAIQSQVSGLTAEAGRALQSFNIGATAGKQRQQLIKDMLSTSGGAENSKVMAGMISSLDNPQQLNQFVKEAAKATNREMLYEAWINGLLSSPATHAVNVIGNSVTTAWSVGERKVASAIGTTLDRSSIPAGEATQMLYGMTNGVKDGFRLAWNALKTGEPADLLTKQESAGYKSITGENLNLTGTPGRFADYVGEVIRIPSRFLTAGDEFFKTVGYRMELQAQAFRQATGEGLEGEALAQRIYDIVQNPPENINLAAIDFSRYQTFTKPLGEAGQSIQTAVQKIPGARVIVPFIRTPVNIMKYVGERTPLSFMAPQIRAEIAAGGARRDMALAKIATGSMIMAAAADASLSGQITGAGPTNPAMRNLKRTTGWQPYSIKVGDEYLSYSRLDPIGATIGLAADIAEIIGQSDDADGLDVATAAVVSVAQNVTSKTYLSGLSEFFEVMSSVSPDPEKNSKRAKKWIERMAGSVVPSGVSQLERTLSPELSATQGIIEKIKSRIPGYSDDLPPRRNIFGEPIVLSGGIGPDIMSPIYISKEKHDKIADEIVKQKTMLRMPTPIIDGIKLDTKMYDAYIKFYAGENNKYVNKPLKVALRELFQNNSYRNATDGQEGGKSVLIKAVFDGYRDAAKQMMREKMPTLAKEIRDKKTEKFRKLGANI